MYYVYSIQSVANPNRVYVGYTTDLRQRLETHNSGGSVYTAKYRPWQLVSYFAFKSEIRAKEFEEYLKTSAGKAFAVKRLW